MRTVDPTSYYDDQLECWIRKDRDIYLVGITDWTQGYIGDISQLHIEVDITTSLSTGDLFAIIESDKSSMELHVPIESIVISKNENVIKNPLLINSDCYGRASDINHQGWIIKVHIANESDITKLLTPDQYRSTVDSFFKKGG